MQTLIVKDKDEQTIARVMVAHYIEVKTPDDLISYLMDKSDHLSLERPSSKQGNYYD